MKFIKPIFILCLFTFQYLTMNAQNDYKAQWASVKSLEKKGLTQDARAEVVKIFADAVKTSNQAQVVKSAMYQMKYRNMVEEDNEENNVFFLDSLVEKAPAPAKNILQSMQAELFNAYKENNRYRLYNRTALLQEESNDINTWSISKINAVIAQRYHASLQNDALLKNTSIAVFDEVLEKGQNTRTLRPTVYDFLVHRALQYFMSDENDVTNPSYKFIINDANAFAAIPIFIQTNFATADTAAVQYKALLLLQQLLRFHQQDANKDALLDADLIRLKYVNEHGVFENKSQLYEAALLSIEKNFSSSDYAAEAMLLRAQEYVQRGEAFNPLQNNVPQWEVKKAVTLAKEIISRYPKAEAALTAKYLLSTIERPSLQFQTEEVNLPGEPFRSLVEYKNTDKIYLRIVKSSHSALEEISNITYAEKWAALLKMQVVKSWQQSLPNPGDYQTHRAEIKVDALPGGTYIILASLQPDFSLAENIIAQQVIYVSQISYIYNSKQLLYVLDRDNGLPLAGAQVQVWKRNYNYTKRTWEKEVLKKLTADKNGLVALKFPRENYNIYLQINYGKDELFTDDTYYNYTYDSYNSRDALKTFLFTDRRIYRPGQTVFFKGIAVSTDSSGRKSKLVTGVKSSIWLFDANHEKRATLKVTGNEYGSFTGSFVLPQGALNGQFYLQDSLSQSQEYFNVEEYKRPKFFAEISKPEGTYRVNDSITIKASAKAYAGNSINDAKVSYRVVRKVRYPVWGYYRMWPPFGQQEQMEIANGQTLTDANGNFTIRFKAIPDETVDKKSQPTFYYEVSADVTDLNGETRSAETTVAVAYQALQLEISGPEKMAADSLHQLKLFSRNLNDLFEKAKVHVEMYALQEPDRIFRERYWEQPDQFTMSKDAYYQAFPYDIYAGENDKANWALGKKVMDRQDSTNANGNWVFNEKPAAGWYKIVATATDKYGETVKTEKFVYLINDKKPAENIPFLVTINDKVAEPGQTPQASFYTGFDKIWMIQSISRPQADPAYNYVALSATKPFAQNINVTEADRGGIQLNLAFVKHNRMYSSSDYIAVPWTNKQLQISYETFRDKLLPGAKERWTVKISGAKGEKLAAEMLVNMYDASLDQFLPHNWTNISSLWPVNSKNLNWSQLTFKQVTAQSTNNFGYPQFTLKPKSYDELLHAGWVSNNMRIMLRGNVSMAMEDKAYKGNEVASDAAPAPGQMRTGSVKKAEAAGRAEAAAGTKKQATNDPEIQVRTNLQETAFFFPQLNTDAEGNVSFSFTAPEALTQWKLMTLAHDKDLASGYLEKKVLTQKPLMVQPNAPRFLREGDKMELVTKIVNMSDKEITGTAHLELMDASSNSSVDGWFQNIFPNQYFTVAAGQSVAVKFPIAVPFNFNSALAYRIKAVSTETVDKSPAFSDGEQAAMPVLTNRVLVTESLPIYMRSAGTKQFSFEKLLKSAAAGQGNNNTLEHHAITVEYSSNPIWYAVQALPYLMEYPYECAEQNFNRYYANVLAAYVANSTPKIKAIFERWKALDTAALMSNLQKNEELKSALLEETPWVLQAKNEAEQKRNIAILFDMVRLGREKETSLNKLKDMQSSNGGFSWFKGGADDRYMTQYILSGIGHLRQLQALSVTDQKALQQIIGAALPYLDARLKDEYDLLIKNKAKLSDNQLSYTAVQYLYMRSFFAETAIASNARTAVAYYQGQVKKYWLSQSKYMQGMIALAQWRSKDAATAKAIIASLKQNAITNPEMGMYWKEFTTGGYYWHQAPIESHAMMVEAFTEIDNNTATINDLKTWLLRQKQTQNWGTTKATAEACYALLISAPGKNANVLQAENIVQISLGSTRIDTDNAEAGTGYIKQRIPAEKVTAQMGNINVTVTSTQKDASLTGGWGAVYWQYFEDLDKITKATTPLSLDKKLFIEKNTDRGPVLTALNDGDKISVGDKVKVRIELRADRNMEYVHMKDMRAAALEPVNVLSGHKWQGGLGYYESTKDASTNFFFGWLPRGTYVFEYTLFATHAGNFSNGVTSIQCMYAPEFTSHSQGVRIEVEQ